MRLPMESLKEFKKRYKKEGLLLLGVFGSYARGDENDASDIDILYEIEEGRKLSMFKYLRCLSELESALNHKVDLVRADKLKPELKSYVYKDIVYV